MVLVGLVLAGCGPRALAWEYTLDPSLASREAAFVGTVLLGGCSGDVVATVAWRVGETPEAGPRLAPRRYGIAIEVRDAACVVIGTGCEEVELPAGGPSVRVDVTPIAGALACDAAIDCDRGLCEGGDRDAGAGDAAIDAPTPTTDTGAGDASLDTGGDAGALVPDCTIDTECPCPGDSCESGRCVPQRVVTEIAAGQRHTCAITAPGWLWCWGDRELGEAALPYDMVLNEPHAVRVGIAADWSDVDAAFLTTCGIQGGVARCFGSNSAAGAGIPDTGSDRNLFAPRTVPGVPAGDAIEVGYRHAMFLTDTGALWGWGDNGNTQVGSVAGVTTPTASLAPAELDAGPWQDIAAGAWFTCGINGAGRLQCWGRTVAGVLGDGGMCPGMMTSGACGSVVDVLEPTPARTWTDIEAGLLHVCALSDAHEVFCWGLGGVALGIDSSGALGAGSIGNSPEPVRVPGLEATRIGLGRHSCAIDTERRLWCWGVNESGEIGVGTMGAPVLDPMLVLGERAWIDVAVGHDHTCAIDADGALHCWGGNLEQQLGLRDAGAAISTQTTPRRVCVGP